MAPNKQTQGIGRISGDTAAMWSLLAIALLIQFGLGQAVQAVTALRSVRQVWTLMGGLTGLIVAVAYRNLSGVLSEVFAWRGTGSVYSISR
jgi:hypothetical protein